MMRRPSFLAAVSAAAVSMLLDLLRPHRLERAVAHVQRQRDTLHPARLERVEDRRGEVKAGSRRRDRAALAGVDGLVAVAVEFRIRALDVGRQRHMADRVDRVPHRRAVVGPQSNGPPPVKMPPDHFGIQRACARRESHPRPFPEALPGMHERDPGVGLIGRPHQKALRRAAARQAHADQPRRKHARVVDHQQITRLQQRRQIGEAMMPDAAARAIERHQSAGAALRRRLLRDQIFGKGKIEVGNVHFF
jgi:hypothetical protein